MSWSPVYVTLLADTALLAIGWDGFFNQGGLISVALCVIVVWATGYIVRQRRRYAVRLQDEAASKAVAAGAAAHRAGNCTTWWRTA